MTGTTEIRIGVSACLLGREVRFDGGHKRDHFVTDLLGDYVTFVAVCPEVEVGMGTPRETLRLVDGNDGAGIRLMTGKTAIDHTASMQRYSQRRLRALQRDDLCGFVLKRGSPSCGMERVKVYQAAMPTKAGTGIFAGILLEGMPNLPIEEEGRLNDARLRENFIERIFAYRRLKDLFAGRWTVGTLVAFHTREKMQLMAHSPQDYRELGRMVAHAAGRDRAELAAAYEALFMAALKKIATTRKHTDVLQHAAGRFKKVLSSEDKAELAGVIEDFRQGLVPLVVPLTLLKHYTRQYEDAYLADQTYLEPHPKEMMLRNHV